MALAALLLCGASLFLWIGDDALENYSDLLPARAHEPNPALRQLLDRDSQVLLEIENDSLWADRQVFHWARNGDLDSLEVEDLRTLQDRATDKRLAAFVEELSELEDLTCGGLDPSAETVTSLIQYRILFSVLAGTIDQALDDFQLLLRWGASLEVPQITGYDETHVGMALLIGESQAATRQQLVRCLQLLPATHPTCENMAEELRSDFGRLARRLEADPDSALGGEFTSSVWNFKLHRTLNTIAFTTRRVVHALEEHCGDPRGAVEYLASEIHRRAAWPDGSFETSDGLDLPDIKWRTLLDSNRAGTRLGDEWLIRLHDLLADGLERQAHLDLTRLLLAQRLYRIDQGTCPDTLDELTDYLPAVPRNLFTGEAIRYDKSCGAITYFGTCWDFNSLEKTPCGYCKDGVFGGVGIQGLIAPDARFTTRRE